MGTYNEFIPSAEIIFLNPPVKLLRLKPCNAMTQAAPLLRSSKIAASELPDPLLRGSFPDEEMQIMARLARECLLWDADSRPSMSEVVQVLSAIAPDRARRRTLSTSVTMVGTNNQKKPNLSWSSQDFTSLSLSLSACVLGQSSSPSTGESGSEGEPELRRSNPGRTQATASTAISALKPPRRWAGDDEESVHLTEPQFESFIQEVVCITIR